MSQGELHTTWVRWRYTQHVSGGDTHNMSEVEINTTWVRWRYTQHESGGDTHNMSQVKIHTTWVKWSYTQHESGGVTHNMSQVEIHTTWVRWRFTQHEWGGDTHNMSPMEIHTTWIRWRYTQHESGGDTHNMSQVEIHTTWVRWRYTQHESGGDTHNMSQVEIHTPWVRGRYTQHGSGGDTHRDTHNASQVEIHTTWVRWRYTQRESGGDTHNMSQVETHTTWVRGRYTQHESGQLPTDATAVSCINFLLLKAMFPLNAHWLLLFWPKNRGSKIFIWRKKKGIRKVYLVHQCGFEVNGINSGLCLWKFKVESHQASSVHISKFNLYPLTIPCRPGSFPPLADHLPRPSWPHTQWPAAPESRLADQRPCADQLLPYTCPAELPPGQSRPGAGRTAAWYHQPEMLDHCPLAGHKTLSVVPWSERKRTVSLLDSGGTKKNVQSLRRKNKCFVCSCNSSFPLLLFQTGSWIGRWHRHFKN